MASTCPCGEKAWLQQQLIAAKEQLAAKDRRIDELTRAAKKLRSTTNSTTRTNNYNQINVFCKESLAHITEAKLQQLIGDRATSVVRVATWKHSECAEVLREDADGNPYWETVPKGGVLEDLVMGSAMLLEAATE